MHTHTHTNTHRLPFRGQCLCQCAGTAGLGMSGNKDRPATGCEAGVVLKFFSVSHRPWDTYRTRTTHTRTHKTSYA